MGLLEKPGSMMEVQVERRKHKRFQAPDRSFAVHGPHVTDRSQIIDIGRGGLAFRYACSTKRLNRSFELDMLFADLDILFSEASFYLGKVPIKTISDIRDNQTPFGSITMRRCGVQFGELTPDQVSQLEYFIQTHTTADAEA